MDSMQDKKTLGMTDYLVFVTTLFISAAIGVYYRFTGGKQETTEEYHLGNRRQKLIPTAVSLMASFMSPIALLGTPAEYYTHGTMFMIIDIGYLVVTPLIAYLFIPVFFKVQAVSAYEYLERRFGKSVRIVASITFSIQMVMYAGCVLYTQAIALQTLTKIPNELSILASGLLCIFYSSIGGIKAVVATEVFQSTLMYSVPVIILVTASNRVGGFGTVWEIAKERGRVEFFDFSFDPTIRHTFWSLLIGGGMQFIALHGISQTAIQRSLTMKNAKSANTALIISAPFLILLSILCGMSGIALFALYKDCDPIKSGQISTPDQLVLFYVLQTLGNYPGLTGVITAGIFSAALSVVSGALNSLSAVTLEDYIKPIYFRVKKTPLEGSFAVFLSKILVVFFGLIALAAALLVKYLGTILQAAITIFGVCGGPLVGVFTLGMLIPIATKQGALVGTIVGLMVSLFLGLGGPKPPIPWLPTSIDGCSSNFTLTIVSPAIANISSTVPSIITNKYFYLFRLSYLWTYAIGFLVTVLVGVTVSLLFRRTKHREELLDVNLFSLPIAAWLKKHQANTIEKNTTANSFENLKGTPGQDYKTFHERINE